MSSPLLDLIGEDKVKEVITRFYDRVFVDPVISHFFFKKNKDHLIRRQTEFTLVLLGSKSHRYNGVSMKAAHRNLGLKNVHFDRRKIIMKETLKDLSINGVLSSRWLKLEEKFRPLLVSDDQDCNH